MTIKENIMSILTENKNPKSVNAIYQNLNSAFPCSWEELIEALEELHQTQEIDVMDGEDKTDPLVSISLLGIIDAEGLI